MTKTIVALYNEFDDARDAIEELRENGIAVDQISIVANDIDSRYSRYIDDDYDGDMDAEEGATLGAFFGGFLGVAAAMIPGIGPALTVGGLLTGALLGGAAGAATGGLAAALIDLDVDKDYANIYAEAVRRGGVLVSVNVPESQVDEVTDILEDYDAEDVEMLADYYRSTGWAGYDESAEPYSAEQIEEDSRNYNTYYMMNDDEFEPYVERFRQHYETNYNVPPNTYEDFLPAYYYGFVVASDGRAGVVTPDWAEVEADLRDEWDDESYGYWDDRKDAIRYSYEHTRRSGEPS